MTKRKRSTSTHIPPVKVARSTTHIRPVGVALSTTHILPDEVAYRLPEDVLYMIRGLRGLHPVAQAWRDSDLVISDLRLGSSTGSLLRPLRDIRSLEENYLIDETNSRHVYSNPQRFLPSFFEDHVVQRPQLNNESHQRFTHAVERRVNSREASSMGAEDVRFH